MRWNCANILLAPCMILLGGMNKSWNLFLISAVVKVSNQLFLLTFFDYSNFWSTLFSKFVPNFSRLYPYSLICGQSCTLVRMHKLKFKSWKISKCTMFARKVLQFCLSHHLSAPPGIEPWGKNNISKDSKSMSQWNNDFWDFLPITSNF